jgi:hypothetical protein
LIQSNSEVAAEQEKALIMTTKQAKSQLEDLSLLAGQTGATIAELKESLVSQAQISISTFCGLPKHFAA